MDVNLLTRRPNSVRICQFCLQLVMPRVRLRGGAAWTPASTCFISLIDGTRWRPRSARFSIRCSILHAEALRRCFRLTKVAASPRAAITGWLPSFGPALPNFLPLVSPLPVIDECQPYVERWRALRRFVCLSNLRRLTSTHLALGSTGSGAYVKVCLSATLGWLYHRR